MVVEALQKANQASGGSVVECRGRVHGALARLPASLDDFRTIPLSVTGATPVLLRDVATVQIGPRCGAASPSWTARAKWPAA
jgi:Cu(I)/Ag(I) efflux system membrane protein CusA/SilA